MPSRLRRALLALTAVLVGITSFTIATPPAAAAGPEEVAVRGRGFGHGRGMGQWGARGYAEERGWSAGQILGHFYGGTTSGQRDPGQPLRVLLCDLENVTICSSGGGVPQIIVTSGAPFIFEHIATFPAGYALRITRDNNRGGWAVEQATGGCGATAWTPVGEGFTGDPVIDLDSTVGQPGDDKTQMLELCGPKRRVYRGVLDYRMDGSKARVINYLGIDDYLKGVVPSEMPSSWGSEALKAQAVAARSYALAGDNRFGSVADTCDTIQCQVYLGASNEKATTNAAIAQTAGQVRIAGNGSVARTEFSASTGGHTAGGAFPAVPDEGDAMASNPHRDWTVNLTDDQIEAAYAIGDLQRIDVLERNGLGADGGRVRRMRIVGSASSTEVTGDAFRSKFGLKSDWFTPTASAPGGPTPSAPEFGWLTRSTATPGPPTGDVRYGVPGYIPIVCDWDNNGTDTLGVYVDGTWYLRDDLRPGAPTRTIQYGAPGYLPVCGDWNGDGQDSIGVYAGGTWYLRNDVGPGAPHISFQYGYPAASPIVGNWDGSDRSVEIGVYDTGTWFLRNSVSPGSPEQVVGYGYAGALPVIGDWNGDGVDGFGVYDTGSWFLRETTTPGPPHRQFGYGYPGPMPIVGRWVVAQDGVGVIETRTG